MSSRKKSAKITPRKLTSSPHFSEQEIYHSLLKQRAVEVVDVPTRPSPNVNVSILEHLLSGDTRSLARVLKGEVSSLQSSSPFHLSSVCANILPSKVQALVGMILLIMEEQDCPGYCYLWLTELVKSGKVGEEAQRQIQAVLCTSKYDLQTMQKMEGKLQLFA